MLKLNREVPNKYLCQASALQMPFKPHSFTFIHFDAMLHHVVGAGRKSSVQQACDVLWGCVALTRKDGFLVLTERCVDSRISSLIIFYGLKFLSGTKLAKLCGVPSGLLVHSSRQMSSYPGYVLLGHILLGLKSSTQDQVFFSGWHYAETIPESMSSSHRCEIEG